MTIENYIKKNGCIYGVSSKYQFGWHYYIKIFKSAEKAIEWLHTEEYDFRERELMTQSKFVKFFGKKKAEELIDDYYNPW